MGVARRRRISLSSRPNRVSLARSRIPPSRLFMPQRRPPARPCPRPWLLLMDRCPPIASAKPTILHRTCGGCLVVRTSPLGVESERHALRT